MFRLSILTVLMLLWHRSAMSRRPCAAVILTTADKVDFTDFLTFVAVFGKQSGDADYNALMDMDDSGTIDFSDFLSFVAEFGTTCASGPIRLTNNDAIEWFPVWSPPDGRKIAFVSGDHLYVMNADGSNSMRLAASVVLLGEIYTPPSWSPDGKKNCLLV